MALSERGKLRSRMASSGGPMHSFLASITDEWREDAPEGICQLDVSENDLIADELSKIIKDLTAQESFETVHLSGSVLPCSSQRLLDAGCLVFNNHFNPSSPVNADQIVAGAGCSLLLEAVARVICDPGDVLLTPVPYWPVFAWLVGKAEVSISTLPIPEFTDPGSLKHLESLLLWSDETERAWEAHLRGLEDRPKGRAKALLLSNPQNPLGRCYSKDYLEGVLAFCEKHDLFLISDEVFGLSLHKDANSDGCFTSILSIDLESRKICDPRRIIVLWSVSKDLGASGARVAFAITPKESPEMVNALMSLAPSFRVSSLADNIFAAFFTATCSSVGYACLDDIGATSIGDSMGSLLSWYISTNCQRLSTAKLQLQEWCSQQEVAYLDADAGNFLMINFGSVIRKRASDNDRDLERSFHAHLLSEGVALQPGYSAMCPGFGWARVTFSRRVAYMKEALLRLDRALANWK